jgi:hypothetical protein
LRHCKAVNPRLKGEMFHLSVERSPWYTITALQIPTGQGKQQPCMYMLGAYGLPMLILMIFLAWRDLELLIVIIGGHPMQLPTGFPRKWLNWSFESKGANGKTCRYNAR